ncbi:MAG TPA: branched-chain amino acid ABC transporter permease [Candidatus Sulfomarinibacteraceae bacterium]|nr:branched-chain amino acid ABC transporter permease [Candidatus Sulfomarinibacteraceae bacterium]
MTSTTGLTAVHPARRFLSFTWITIAIAVLVTVVAGIDNPVILVNTLTTGGMWALMAGGLALVFGVMNIPNFAHGEFFMIGSLVAFTVFSPIQDQLSEDPTPLLRALGPLPGIVVATVVGAIVGVVMEVLLFRPLRRRSRDQWVMNTFLLTAGVSVVLVNGDQLLFGNDFRGITRYWDVPALKLLGVSVSVDRVLVFLIAIVTIAIFSVFLRSTRMGRAMRAVAQDETGAQMAGIDLNRVFMLTLGLSCGLASLAGASLLFLFPSYPSVGVQPLYLAWYVVILAGLGNVSGAVVGAFIVALLQTLTAFYIGVGWVDVLPTAFIIVILLFKPSGLFGSEVKGVWEQ